MRYQPLTQYHGLTREEMREEEAREARHGFSTQIAQQERTDEFSREDEWVYRHRPEGRLL